MRHRLSVCDSGDLLLEQELVLTSGAEITDVEGAFEHELGQGYSRGIVLDGLVIVRETNTVKRDVVLQSDQDPAGVELHCSLGEDNVVAHVEGLREALRFRPGTHVLHYTPASRLRFALAPDVRYERFEMNFTTGYFASLAERYPELLEVIFSQVDRQQPFCFHPRGHTLTPRMKSVVRQILESREQGPLRRMFIEAKVAELLVFLLRQHEERESLPQVADLPKHDVDRMHEAHHLVLTRMDDPPSLPELARQVGTNEFKLKRDFKAVFDNTVYGLLLDHKMEHARTLLLDTDRSVSEIACEVGYAHTASFSTAFKKTFGVTPSTLRKSV